jgi:hypothetical protein
MIYAIFPYTVLIVVAVIAITAGFTEAYYYLK